MQKIDCSERDPSWYFESHAWRHIDHYGHIFWIIDPGVCAPSAPLAVEANNLKSQSQQEGMWLEAQVNLYNMWTPIGKSDVKFFLN